MASRPLALDASPSDRRALRFKCFTFYGKWEPKKSIPDVNDLCEWALENGVAAFNAKLKSKYGEDLTSVTINSYLDLPLETQLKLFYSEFDPNKPQKEIDDVAIWARQRGNDGTIEINQRMNKKCGFQLIEIVVCHQSKTETNCKKRWREFEYDGFWRPYPHETFA